MYYFITPRELPTKMDIVMDSAWNGDDQDPSQEMCGSLLGPPNLEHQKDTSSCAKPNEVVKDVENVF